MSSNFYNEGDNQQYIEVAELTTTCNKYHPGKQTFYIPALNPMNSRPNDTTEIKETVDGSTASVICASNLLLELPKEVARNYPKKFIPPGTRFLVAFIGGDLTKPVIIGRDYDGYEIHESE